MKLICDCGKEIETYGDYNLDLNQLDEIESNFNMIKNVYYDVNGKGRVIIDEEGMRGEFENELKNLKEFVDLEDETLQPIDIETELNKLESYLKSHLQTDKLKSEVIDCLRYGI